MFNRLTLILTSIYFLAGNILLPQGDFCAISQLQEMYHHCKTTEDPDMNLAEFITGHLLNLDIDEENDEPGEHELPHNPQPFHNAATCIFYNIDRTETITIETTHTRLLNQPEYHSPYFSRLNTHKIFQPPRV